MRNNARQTLKLKFGSYLPCRNFAQKENQQPRQPPCLVRENERAEEKPTTLLAKGWVTREVRGENPKRPRIWTLTPPHRPREGVKKRKEVLEDDPMGEIFGRRAWLRKRNGVVEMCVVPLFIQKPMSKYWILELDCWFMKFDSLPLSDPLGKTILMFKNPIGPNIERLWAWLAGLWAIRRKIFKISTQGGKYYAVVNTRRLVGLLEIRYKQPTAQLLSEIQHRIKSLNQIAPTELGEGGTNPECIWKWLLGKMMFWWKHVSVERTVS